MVATNSSEKAVVRNLVFMSDNTHTIQPIFLFVNSFVYTSVVFIDSRNRSKLGSTFLWGLKIRFGSKMSFVF